jgi:hypothetical protein
MVSNKTDVLETFLPNTPWKSQWHFAVIQIFLKHSAGKDLGNEQDREPVVQL